MVQWFEISLLLMAQFGGTEYSLIACNATLPDLVLTFGGTRVAIPASAMI